MNHENNNMKAMTLLHTRENEIQSQYVQVVIGPDDFQFLVMPIIMIMMSSLSLSKRMIPKMIYSVPCMMNLNGMEDALEMHYRIGQVQQAKGY